VKWAFAALLGLLAQSAAAATAYVSDELILGVYSEENGQGQRLTTLHSGASLETLGASGEYTHVRLADGTVGWVKSSYLTTTVPATVRVKQLEDELDRARATTPGLAAAAAHNEADDLEQQLASSRAELQAIRAQSSARSLPPAPARGAVKPWVAALLVAAAAGLGYWLGHALLAARIRRKFGGLKVY
jgi:SH3 domain protein